MKGKLNKSYKDPMLASVATQQVRTNALLGEFVESIHDIKYPSGDFLLVDETKP